MCSTMRASAISRVLINTKWYRLYFKKKYWYWCAWMGLSSWSQLMRIPRTMGSIDLWLWQNIYIFSVHESVAADFRGAALGISSQQQLLTFILNTSSKTRTRYFPEPFCFYAVEGKGSERRPCRERWTCPQVWQKRWKSSQEVERSFRHCDGRTLLFLQKSSQRTAHLKPVARINIGNVLFCKPQICWKML